MTDEKKYRTEVPNIIDDLGLDPHERALYVHYKRACGGNDCEWVESIRITGQRTKMSFSRASMARKSLAERGLIHLISKGNDGTAVRIVNIWDLNTAFYQHQERPDIDGWTVEQLKEWVQGVHIMNTIKEESLESEPEKAGVHNANAGVHIMNNKKEPLKNEPIKELPIGNGGKPPEPEFSQPAFSEEFTLEPDTPETALIFEKVNLNRRARKGYGPTKRFKSIEQKKKCLTAIIRLGPEFEAGLTCGLENGITEVKDIVNWLAKYKGAKPNGNASRKYVGAASDHRPEPTAGEIELADQIKAALRARARTGGDSPKPEVRPLRPLPDPDSPA